MAHVYGRLRMKYKFNLRRRMVVGLCLSLPFSLLYAKSNLGNSHPKLPALLRKVIEKHYSGFKKNYFGKRYLESHGTFVEVNSLIEELSNLKNVHKAYLKLENLIKKDYIVDNIIFIDGWIFSITEIRVNALRHLYSI